MQQIIIAHAQSNMRQCPHEMDAYQLHKPPRWKVFSPAAAVLESEEIGDPGDEVSGNLVGAHNTQRSTPPLSPHLAHATAFHRSSYS